MEIREGLTPLEKLPEWHPQTQVLRESWRGQAPSPVLSGTLLPLACSIVCLLGQSPVPPQRALVLNLPVPTVPLSLPSLALG